MCTPVRCIGLFNNSTCIDITNGKILKKINYMHFIIHYIFEDHHTETKSVISPKIGTSEKIKLEESN